MPLLDHFHPPLHGPRRWEGFHHSWATFIARQLNQDVLPPEYRTSDVCTAIARELSWVKAQLDT